MGETDFSKGNSRNSREGLTFRILKYFSSLSLPFAGSEFVACLFTSESAAKLTNELEKIRKTQYSEAFSLRWIALSRSSL